MPQMQVTIGFWWETRVDAVAKTASGVVFGNAGTNKVHANFTGFAGGCGFVSQGGGGHLVIFGGHNALQ